jgi:hypothetical protein
MAVSDHELIAWMMVSLLACVIGLGFLAFLVIRSRAHQRQAAAFAAGTNKKLSSGDAPHHLYLSWKRPTCWLAIKNHNLQSVQSALALHNPKPCTWVEGIAGDGEQKLFIAPPVSGWILVIGPALPDPAEDVDVCYRFLADLSRKLGHVQFFNANSMLNQHAWVQADHGHILRGYAWAGKTLWNQGAITSAESELRLKCYDYADSPDAPQYGSAHPAANNSDKVHLLAARWSVDPDEIDERFIEHEWGIIGQRSRLY